jgi:hypothetical protein
MERRNMDQDHLVSGTPFCETNLALSNLPVATTGLARKKTAKQTQA